MNCFNGEQLTKTEIKRRLEKMGIPFDRTIVIKLYFETLYNKAIVNEDNRLKIKDELVNDNSFKVIKRIRDPVKEPQSLNQNNNVMKQRVIPFYAPIKEVKEEYEEADSILNERKSKSKAKNEDKAASEKQSSQKGSKFISFGIGMGLGIGFTSAIGYRNALKDNMAGLIDKLPSFEEIIKNVKEIYEPIKNWTVFITDVLTDLIKPTAKVAYTQLMNFINQINFGDVRYIVPLFLFAIIVLFFLIKYSCRKKTSNTDENEHQVLETVS